MASKKADVLEHLNALADMGALDPKDAARIAWEAGYKEADRTFEQRRQERVTAMQLQNIAGTGGR